jgi:leucyl aminopeptidase
MMKTFVLISLFLHFVLSTSFVTPQILQASVGVTEANIKHLLAAHDDDPVEVMRLVDPVYTPILDEPRLLQVLGTEPVWLTEGDKLRLKKQGLSFMDLTGHEYHFMSTVSSTQDIGVYLFL